jgi:hypothetical protein
MTDKLKTALEHGGWDISKVAKGAGQALWDEIVEAFSITSEDSEYGVDALNDVENELYDPNGGKTFGKEIQRMPLFGINKLDNMELLSRDLFYSTLMYAAMACKYDSMSVVARATQVGEQVYSRLRKEINKGYTKKYGGKPISASYSTFDRVTRGLDKNVFGKRNIQNIGKFSLNKISSVMSKIGSLVTVAGNVPSGAKDFLGKLQGILREAHVQDYVSAKSVAKAFWWYTKHMWEHMMYLGMSYSKDPISQFKSYFNVSDALDSEINDFEPQKWHIRKFFDSLAYMPLTASGAIENIIYIAVAFDTEIRDVETGKKMSLMDKFEKDRKELKLRQNNEEIYNRDIEVLKDTSVGTLDRYAIVKSTSEKMNEFFKNGGTNIFELHRLLTPEEIAYISEYLARGITDYKKIAILVEEERRNMLYDTKDEAVGVEGLGRFINHRISGVYDIHDRTALQDTWYGSLLYAQKGWFTGAIAEAEFIQNHFNTKTKAENEGAKVTTIKYLLDLFNSFSNYKKFPLKEHIYLKKDIDYNDLLSFSNGLEGKIESPLIEVLQGMTPTLEGIKLIMQIFSFFALAVSILTLFVLTVLDFENKQKEYAMLKQTGYKKSDIFKINMFKIVFSNVFVIFFSIAMIEFLKLCMNELLGSTLRLRSMFNGYEYINSVLGYSFLAFLISNFIFLLYTKRLTKI